MHNKRNALWLSAVFNSPYDLAIVGTPAALLAPEKIQTWLKSCTSEEPAISPGTSDWRPVS